MLWMGGRNREEAVCSSLDDGEDLEARKIEEDGIVCQLETLGELRLFNN